MKARRDRLARALMLSDKLWRVQTMRLGQIEAKLAELREAELVAIAALESNLLEPSLLLHRLHMLAQSRIKAQEAHREQLARVEEYGRRAKQAERLFERVDRAFRRERAMTDLQSVIDRSDVRPP